MATATKQQGQRRVVSLTNIGPISELAIPIPEEGGVVVLQGRNGAGKSTALEAVESAIRSTKTDSLTVKDGELSGRFEGLGVKLVVGKSVRRTGTLEVQSLDSRLNIADFVDPGLKDDGAADSKRIKALLGVCGMEPDVTLFYELFGGQEKFAEVVHPSVAEKSDIVAMAAKIKSEVESAARTAEAGVETSQREAVAATNYAQGVTAEQVAAFQSRDQLQFALEKSLEGRSALQREAQLAMASAARLREARVAMTTAESEYKGPSVSGARVLRENAENTLTELGKALASRKEIADRANEHVRQTERLVEFAHRDAIAAGDLVIQAEAHAEHVSQFRAILDGVLAIGPCDEEIDAADRAVALAREAVEQGVVKRQAGEHLVAAVKHKERANWFGRRAKHLREIAGSVDEVLSGLVAKVATDVKVQGGRLVTTTGRGKTYFSDLSPGERWRMAIGIAVKVLGRGCLLVVPQECWEALDPLNRLVVADAAVASGVVILTALPEIVYDEEGNERSGITAEVLTSA